MGPAGPVWPEWLKYGPIERMTGVLSFGPRPAGRSTSACSLVPSGSVMYSCVHFEPGGGGSAGALGAKAAARAQTSAIRSDPRHRIARRAYPDMRKATRAMDARPPSHSRSELARWMGIGDANTAGNVHGGTIMYLCDEVAGIAAIRHCGRRVVTAGMDRMTFEQPVLVGHLVTVKATVNAAWRTSMEVGVRVEAENV